MIIDKIKKDNLEARKNRDSFKSTILTTLLSEILIVGKNNGNRNTSEVEATTVIKKFISNAENIVESLQCSHNRESCAEQIQKVLDEIEIYESYLPKQLTEDELEDTIKNIIENGATSIGAIMSVLKESIPGMYDGKTALIIIRKLLNV